MREYEARINSLIDTHCELQARYDKLLEFTKAVAANFENIDSGWGDKLLKELGECE